jgi:hypothetical protein
MAPVMTEGDVLGHEPMGIVEAEPGRRVELAPASALPVDEVVLVGEVEFECVPVDDDVEVVHR